MLVWEIWLFWGMVLRVGQNHQTKFILPRDAHIQKFERGVVQHWEKEKTGFSNCASWLGRARRNHYVRSARQEKIPRF